MNQNRNPFQGCKKKETITFSRFPPATADSEYFTFPLAANGGLHAKRQRCVTDRRSRREHGRETSGCLVRSHKETDLSLERVTQQITISFNVNTPAIFLRPAHAINGYSQACRIHLPTRRLSRPRPSIVRVGISDLCFI
ncbi:hypothetical protein EVAR_29549_1 [Eumeta japonica]|uniref:Uncharacterized protein n=1 Tax=Eumeta variegata TaxID=151549 RepID=A0A4C1WET8_EUMVA|nr:hypothetical protein EVAR_29549_1 [Eumeta japonica]